LIAAHGAVSVEVARALAEGARRRFGTSLGVGITGVAGPGGGSAEKPVGFVCFCVAYGAAGDASAVRARTRARNLPGERADVRERSTTVAMHLIARVLRGEGD
jgi:nicotinamide-nucleotide amidase